MKDMDMKNMNHDDMKMNMSSGHDMMMHGGHMMDMGDLKQKFWISLVMAIPVFILSPFMGLHLPFQFQFPGSDWIVLILSTALYF